MRVVLDFTCVSAIAFALLDWFASYSHIKRRWVVYVHAILAVDRVSVSQVEANDVVLSMDQNMHTILLLCFSLDFVGSLQHCIHAGGSNFQGF